VDEIALRALALGAAGIVVTAGTRTADGLVVGRADRETVRASVRRLRDRTGANATLVAAGGMHEPADAIDLRADGASLVAMDSGFVFGGPGLPKRANEAIADTASPTRSRSPASIEPASMRLTTGCLGSWPTTGSRSPGG
jgi:dihydroorotate dehydrogenase